MGIKKGFSFVPPLGLGGFNISREFQEYVIHGIDIVFLF